MHSNKASVIIALIIIAISIFLLVVYSSKQGKHTFSFIESLYNEIRADQTSVSVRMDCETMEEFDVIRAIAKAYPDLPIQVGGGIRDEKTIEAYLNAGVDFVIIGTQAVKEPEFVGRVCSVFPGHVIVGLDAKDGMVAIDGWATVTGHEVTDLSRRFEQDGVSAIVYTDIGRDGMLTGPNVEATAALANAITIPVIASGGITDIGDIDALCKAETENIMGAITGRAIYEGTLDFAEGQNLADEYRNNLC